MDLSSFARISWFIRNGMNDINVFEDGDIRPIMKKELTKSIGVSQLIFLVPISRYGKDFHLFTISKDENLSVEDVLNSIYEYYCDLEAQKGPHPELGGPWMSDLQYFEGFHQQIDGMLIMSLGS